MISELVKRLIVDSENLSEYRNKFFNGESFSDEEISSIISTTPNNPCGNKHRLTLLAWNSL